MREPRVLVVADDLTGAMDSAGPFAARGVETWVVAMPLRGDPAALARARVVSVNTDSRHLAAREAAARVGAVVRPFAASGFDIFIKKIDSTLRGNVVSETLAMRAATGRHAVLVAPAFPTQGRTVRKGMVHVEGRPLAQTAFAHDALSPAPVASLQEIFAATDAGLRVCSAGADGAFDDSADIWIADSATDADLLQIVRTVKPRLGQTLMVGSAGLTQAIAATCCAVHPAAPGPRGVTGTIVFAVGSRASRSAEQVEALETEPHTCVLHAPNGQLPSTAIPAAKNLVLKATADLAGHEADAERVAADMARHALELARATRAQVLVATGGDTAIAVLAASGNPALQVLGDLMPGIPYARIRLDGAALWLVTKAGGFGARNTFRDIARSLRAG